MEVDIISTGSKGNAVVLNGIILIDCGVSFSKLKDVKKYLKLVLLTHIHSDHFNPSAVRALHQERPGLRFCCCDWMVRPLLDAGVSAAAIDVFSLERPLCYAGIGTFQPFPLCHDVSNCGWRLFLGPERAIYATDTGSMDHVEAKNYDLYLIEANHKQAELEERLARKEAEGAYAYERRAAVTHLSEEQAFAWLAENAGPCSKYIFLHQHDFGKDDKHG